MANALGMTWELPELLSRSLSPHIIIIKISVGIPSQAFGSNINKYFIHYINYMGPEDATTNSHSIKGDVGACY